jgi:sporulation protein YlmC with PRC-barrel domain
MTEAEFEIGAEASCSDGSCGKVRRLVIDPGARTVTHLVIEPRHRGQLGRLVPVGLVDTTTGHIRLRCTIAEFGQLDPAEETDVVANAGYGEAGSVPGYVGAGGLGVGGPGYGLGVGLGRGEATPIVVNDVVPPGETDLRRGEHVHALDGEIGRVAGLLTDPGDHQVTHVLLQEGHLWGRKEVAIPVSAVTAVDDGIRLSITKKQVEDLPPVATS